MSRLNLTIPGFGFCVSLTLMMSLLLAACGSDDSLPEESSSPETDREALIALFHATDGPNWLRNANWLTDTPLDDWYGVSTDEDGRVTKLELPANDLSGSIPPELGNLDRLKVLDLAASRTMTRVSIRIGNGQSEGGPARGLADDPTDEDIDRLLEQAERSFDNRDPISRAIDQIAEQAADPENAVVERNYLSGCIPSNLMEQLDLEASDLGGLPFCGGESPTNPEDEQTAGDVIDEHQRQRSPGPQRANCYSTFDEKDICYSIESGDVEAVRKLLDEGADVNAVDEEGQSRLAMSITTGTEQSLEMIEMLVKAPGADVNVETSYQGTVLNAAITTLDSKLEPADHIRVVQTLVEAGADVNWQGEGYPSDPPLRGAVHSGNVDIVGILVDAGADPTVFDGPKDSRIPIISYAFSKGSEKDNWEIVRILVSAGAGPGEYIQDTGAPLLSRAVRTENIEALKFLVDAGANPNEGLYAAFESSDTEMMLILFEAGADPDANIFGFPLLHIAIDNGDAEMARILVEAGADVNAGDTFFDDKPLIAAINGGETEIVRILVSAGADVNAVDDEFWGTPLDVAKREGHSEIIRILTKAGAIESPRNGDGDAGQHRTAAGDSSRSNTTKDQGPTSEQSETSTTSDAVRLAFETSAPSGYTEVRLTDRGTVWGIPERFTTDSNLGAVAYMLLGKLKGCNFAKEELDRSSIVYAKGESLGHLSSYESGEVCRKTSNNWDTGWDGVRLTHLQFFDETSPTNVREFVYKPASGEYVEVSGGVTN